MIHGTDVVDPIDGRLRELYRRFEPDASILFVRDPLDNYEAMLSHVRKTPPPGVALGCRAGFGYMMQCGNPATKLLALEVPLHYITSCM